MAQAPVVRQKSEDWKSKLNIPAKDPRIQTEASALDLILGWARTCCYSCSGLVPKYSTLSPCVLKLSTICQMKRFGLRLAKCYAGTSFWYMVVTAESCLERREDCRTEKFQSFPSGSSH